MSISNTNFRLSSWAVKIDPEGGTWSVIQWQDSNPMGHKSGELINPDSTSYIIGVSFNSDSDEMTVNITDDYGVYMSTGWFEFLGSNPGYVGIFGDHSYGSSLCAFDNIYLSY